MRHGSLLTKHTKLSLLQRDFNNNIFICPFYRDSISKSMYMFLDPIINNSYNINKKKKLRDNNSNHNNNCNSNNISNNNTELHAIECLK